jgi:hypothetical protein
MIPVITANNSSVSFINGVKRRTEMIPDSANSLSQQRLSLASF